MSNTGCIFPRLETERLILREMALDDAPAVFQNFSDPEVVEYMIQPVVSLAEAQGFIQEWIDGYRQRKALVWAITLKPDGTFLGTCGYEVFNWKSRRGEIGYDINRAYWGKGLVTEAMRAVLGFSFGDLELHRIEANAVLDNVRSVNLLRRLGFRHEGTFRERIYLKDRFWDQGFFALLEQDWLSQSGTSKRRSS